MTPGRRSSAQRPFFPVIHWKSIFRRTPAISGQDGAEASPIQVASQLNWIGIAATLSSILLYAYIYWQTGFSQVGYVLAGVVLAFGLTIIARRRWQFDDLNTVENALIAAILLAYAGGELSWANLTLAHTIGVFFLLFSISNISAARGSRAWGKLAFSFAIYLIVILVVNRILTPQRVDVSSSAGLTAMIGWYVPAITIGMTLIGLWQLIQLFQASSLRARLLFAFTLTVLIPLLASGVFTTYSSIQIAQQRITDQLQSVAALKEANLLFWTQTLQASLREPFIETDYNRINIVIHKADNLPNVVDFNYRELRNRLNIILLRAPLLQDLFILDEFGNVVVSSRTDLEGQNFLSESFFRRGSVAPTITPPFYFRPQGSYAVIVSQPVIRPDGVTIGVIAGLADFQVLDNIMNARSGLGLTSATYLVGINGDLLNNTSATDAGTLVSTLGISSVIRSKSDTSGIFSDTKGQEVIGVYHWVSDLSLVLAAEQDRDEALAPYNRITIINLAAGGAALLFAILSALLVTRSLATPLTSLARIANDIAAGQFDQQPASSAASRTISLDRRDEVGQLARALNSMSNQLRSLIGGLEAGVAQRTSDLERRTNQLRLASEVARDIASARDLDELLSQAVEVIRSRFNFYFVAIFINAETAAILRAASGEAGRKLLAQNYRLPISSTLVTAGRSQVTLGTRLSEIAPGAARSYSETTSGARSIVASVVEQGQAHIAQDVEKDQSYLNNPLLPYTRSELALPLRIGRGPAGSSTIIGVLDVQSIEERAFDSDDVTILQTVADQLAVAIENTRLIERLQTNLAELERAYAQVTRQSWQDFTDRRSAFGPDGNAGTTGSSAYRYTGLDAVPLTQADLRPEAARALAQSEVIIEDISSAAEAGDADPTHNLAIPVRLREQVIGVLNLRFESPVTPDTVQLVSAAGERLALLLENARLLQDAQRLAEREQQINIISNQVRGSTEVEDILQNTVRELGRLLGASRTFIQLGAIATSEGGNGAAPSIPLSSSEVPS